MTNTSQTKKFGRMQKWKRTATALAVACIGVEETHKAHYLYSTPIKFFGVFRDLLILQNRLIQGL
jgi:hypothetical protein